MILRNKWLAYPGLAVKKVVAPLLHALALRVPRSPEWVPGPLTYNQDGLATVHNCDFLRDPRFQEAYRLGEATGSWWDGQIHWRVYVVCWAAVMASRLEGDFVECGVNRGGYARAVMHYVDFPNLHKTFYLLDTFRGLDPKYVTDAERKLGVMDYPYDECYEAVQKTFAGLPAVLVRGAIPETLPQVKTAKVGYLSIDMNCAAPEIAAAEYFWDRLVPGAVMILDDYGWTIHRGQKTAFDRFARERGVMILSLPTGQGLIFKP